MRVLSTGWATPGALRVGRQAPVGGAAMVLMLYCCADTNSRLRERLHSGQQDSGLPPYSGLRPCTERAMRGTEMKILICDQQRMLAEALASALDARGYDILAVTTTVSGALSSARDWAPDVCLIRRAASTRQSIRPGYRSCAILQGYRRHEGAGRRQRSVNPETLAQLMPSGAAGLTNQDRKRRADRRGAGRDRSGSRSVPHPEPLRVPARQRNRLCELVTAGERDPRPAIAGGSEHQADVRSR